MSKTILVIFVILLALSPVVSAEEIDSPDDSSIFKLPDHKNKGIKENMKPFNLEELTKKSKETGERLYLFLQSNSVIYLLICLGLGLVFLVLGIVFKFFRAMAGFAILVGIVGFLLINFAPDLVNKFISTVTNMGSE